MPEIIPNLHPSIVHFPIALITVSALFHIAATATRGKFLSTNLTVLARTLLWLSALSVLPAVFFGWQAYNSVSHDDVSHAAMLIHRNWALGTSLVLIILAGWDAWRNKIDAPTVWWFVVALIGAWSMVVITAWHGGELVYRHGLGVMSPPALQDSVDPGSHRDNTTDMAAQPDSDKVPFDQVQQHSQHPHTH